VIKLIPTLLMIPVCSLAVGAAYAADAPDGPVRIAAISSLDPAAPPKPLTHAVAPDLASRQSSLGTAVPLLSAPDPVLPYQDATPRETTAPAVGTLDLRPADLQEIIRQQDALQPATPEDSDEAQAVAVVASPLTQMRPDTHVSHAGIGSLYWAAHNPAQAWRVLLPVRLSDGSGASADIKAMCAVSVVATAPRTPSCP
jgi:hypothetical protein